MLRTARQAAASPSTAVVSRKRQAVAGPFQKSRFVYWYTITEQSTPAVPESATLQPSHTAGRAAPGIPSQPACSSPSHAAYAAASAANRPNARISRLSHECRSPMTARYACCGRPRCSTLTPSASSPNASALALCTGRMPALSAPGTNSSSIRSTRNAPTDNCVSASIRISDQCASAGRTAW